MIFLLRRGWVPTSCSEGPGDHYSKRSNPTPLKPGGCGSTLICALDIVDWNQMGCSEEEGYWWQ